MMRARLSKDPKNRPLHSLTILEFNQICYHSFLRMLQGVPLQVGISQTGAGLPGSDNFHAQWKVEAFPGKVDP
jgi:hypothetical protein